MCAPEHRLCIGSLAHQQLVGIALSQEQSLQLLFESTTFICLQRQQGSAFWCILRPGPLSV